MKTQNAVNRHTTFKKTITPGNSHKFTENYSNENIFKNDSDYRMKQDLRFDQDNDEQNCNKNVFMRFIDLLNVITMNLLLNNIFSIWSEWRSYSLLLTLGRLFIVGLSFFNLFIVSNIDKFISNILYLRWFLEIDTVFTLMISVNNSDITEYNLGAKFFYCLIFNLIFNITASRSIIFYLVEALMLLLCLNNPSTSNIFTQLFYNVFSLRGLYILFISMIFIITEYFINKGVREIWALYDSFKRSFFTLKNISDDLPFPVFILNIKKQTSANTVAITTVYQTYYKNLEAEKLFHRVKRTKEKSTGNIKLIKSQKVDINFKELFDKSVEKLLDSEIEKCCQNNVRCFDFPLIIGEAKLSFKQSVNFPTLYEGDLECIKWVKIIVNPTAWKGTECVMVQIMENDDLQHDYFLEKYEYLINKEFMGVLENVDVMCEKAPDLKTKEKDTMKSPTPSTFHSRNVSQLRPSGNITPEILRSPNPNTQIFIKSPIILAAKGYGSPQNMFEGLDIARQSISPNKKQNMLNIPLIDVNFEKSKSNAALREQPAISLISPGQLKLNFDYATIFLIKNSTNYLYDMYLTINILNSLRMNKIQKKLTKFHFENFIKYLVCYFTPILNLKNFKIEFNSEVDGEVNAVYDYYRVVFFNTILFILTNSKTKATEQTLSINVVFTRFSDEGSSYYEVNFLLKDDDPKIPYNLLIEYMSFLKMTDLRSMNYEKYKIIDIGLVTSSFIVNMVYNSEFRITSNDSEHKFSFLIFNHGGSEELKQIGIKTFTVKNYESEEKYYSKIVDKIYRAKKDLIHKGSFKAHSARRTPVFKSEEEDDRFDAEEDKNYKLSKDWEQYKDIHLLINNNFGSHENILLTKGYLEKIVNIKDLSKKLKIIPVLNYEYEPFTAIWDNTSTINNIKYCPIPRFLIVEDNIVGRMSIKDELKRLRLEHRHDIAADGREAVNKFKILLNQGYIFDFIFMDIYLPEMGGVEATKAIRNIESSYNVHSNVVAVTVEGKKDLEEGIFDEYFEKPIRNSDKFFSYISKHFKNNRPEISYKDFK